MLPKWEDLRERRLIQILVAYLGGGFVALEAFNQLVERSVLPELVYQMALVLYLAGIPAAAIIGWFHGERGQQQVSRLEVAMLAVVAVVGIGAVAIVVDRHQAQADAAAPGDLAGSSLDLRRIGVLYFHDAAGDGALQYLADGLTEGLIDQLSEVRSLDVVSANGVRPYRGLDIRRDSIAHALGTGILVDGAVERAGAGISDDERSQIRVTTRLLDGESGTVLERSTVEMRLGAVLEFQDSIAAGIARGLRSWMGDVTLRDRRAETASTAAWTLYQRARVALRDAEPRPGHHGPDPAVLLARADSLLERAEALDPAWTRPVVERGWLAYRRSRAAHDPEQAGGAIQAGLDHAARALALDPNHAPALELRGTLAYWNYLLQLTPDPGERARLLSRARADLERSVQIDPSLARAHANLSHLYYQIGDLASVVLAARRAYEEDAYLAEAPQVLWRLFLGNYDLGQFRQAQGWCDVGRARFDHDPNFALCRLYVMTTPATEPRVEDAWRDVAALDSILGPRADPRRSLARVLTGAIIGRAGMPDSADHVLRAARLGPGSELDPNLELFAYEAFARSRFGDDDGALELLKRYVAVNHGFERGGVRHWWWEGLREHPGFRALETSAH